MRPCARSVSDAYVASPQQLALISLGMISRSLDDLVQDLGVSHRSKAARRELMRRGPEATRALQRGLSNSNPAVRVGCCVVLDHHLDALAIPDLLVNVTHEDAQVRRWAMHTLACDRCKEGECRPGENDTVPLAMQMLTDDVDYQARTAAVHALGPSAHTHATTSYTRCNEHTRTIRIHSCGRSPGGSSRAARSTGGHNRGQRASGRDHQLADQVAGNPESVSQIDHSTWEVALETVRDEPGVGRDQFGTGEGACVGELRRRMREPVADLVGTGVLVAVVDHDGIGGERRERRVGVPPVMRTEVAADHLGQIGFAVQGLDG